jgi:aerotaxis receptor
MVEELAASAKSLNDQVGMVHNTIRVFRLTPQDTTLAEGDAVALRKQGRGDLAAEAELTPAQPGRIGMRSM